MIDPIIAHKVLNRTQAMYRTFALLLSGFGSGYPLYKILYIDRLRLLRHVMYEFTERHGTLEFRHDQKANSQKDQEQVQQGKPGSL